ncbi:MAG: bifunctional adenosylcobinamide kinase/adenosylcobinamide-phosphate guanylyltransferase [Azospirillaceae bacterium]
MSAEVRPAAPLPRVTLVLGGARSGKSARAEALVEESGLAPVYVATAQAFDEEMRARIAEHRARRGPAWHTVEAPMALAATLEAEAAPGRAVLVDCLTLWLTNLLLAERDCAAEGDGLVAALGRLAGPAVVVSNEVGLGIVPDNALARRFRDEAGRLNQAVARIADRVEFLAAGLVLPMKTEAAPAAPLTTEGPMR